MQGPEQGLMITVKSTSLYAFALELHQYVTKIRGRNKYAAYSGSQAPAVGYT
jgi:hypothetical protein